jgi:nucleoside 2-deoxyribosyltransferase
MTIEITFKHDAEKYPTKIKDLLKKYGISTNISNEEAVQILQRTPQFIQDTQDYAQERENYKKMSNDEIKKLPQCDEKWIMSYNKSKIIIVDEQTEMTRISVECKKIRRRRNIKSYCYVYGNST